MVRLIGVVGEEDAKPGRSCTARRQVPLTLEPGLTMVGFGMVDNGFGWYVIF